MIRKLDRPVKIQERINKIEEGLIELFSKITEKKGLDYSEIALIPLSRRGVGLLPKRAAAERNALVSVLQQFGHFEEYALFPLIDRILEFNTILLFDDICVLGDHLKEYENYLKELCKNLSPLEDKDVIWATYLIKKDIMDNINKEYKKDKVYSQKILDEEGFEVEIPNVFLFIACKGEIIDPDHMFVEVELEEKQEFFTLWEGLEQIAKNNHCKLVEDGINFLHPKRKKLGLFVEGEKKLSLEKLGFRFPEFVEKIEIAKFRMVFELEMPESNDGLSVFTKRFEAVPIINPIIDNTIFSPAICNEYWNYCQFCKKRLISEKECKEKHKHRTDYLHTYYYNPGYDCVICNLVKPFSNYFLTKIESLLEGNMKKPDITWLHQERLDEFWRKFGAL